MRLLGRSAVDTRPSHKGCWVRSRGRASQDGATQPIRVHRELELQCVPLGRSPTFVDELGSRIDDQSGAADSFCQSLDCGPCPEIVEDRGAELRDQRAQARHIALELVDRGTHGIPAARSDRPRHRTQTGPHRFPNGSPATIIETPRKLPIGGCPAGNPYDLGSNADGPHCVTSASDQAAPERVLD
jgi:hypothetical protein